MNQHDPVLKELQSAREYLFELFDQTDQPELKVTLRVLNNEIKRRLTELSDQETHPKAKPESELKNQQAPTLASKPSPEKAENSEQTPSSSEVTPAKPAREPEPAALANSKEAIKSEVWTEEEDRYLSHKCGTPARSRDAAKQLLREAAAYLLRSEAETFTRIRNLGLFDNLRAWANSSPSSSNTGNAQPAASATPSAASPTPPPPQQSSKTEQPPVLEEEITLDSSLDDAANEGLWQTQTTGPDESRLRSLNQAFQGIVKLVK